MVPDIPPGLATGEGRPLGCHKRGREGPRPDRAAGPGLRRRRRRRRRRRLLGAPGGPRRRCRPARPGGAHPPGLSTRSVSTAWNWTTRHATMPRAGLPPSPAISWRAPSAALPCTTTADTTCTYTPGSEETESDRSLPALDSAGSLGCSPDDVVLAEIRTGLHLDVAAQVDRREHRRQRDRGHRRQRDTDKTGQQESQAGADLLEAAEQAAAIRRCMLDGEGRRTGCLTRCGHALADPDQGQDQRCRSRRRRWGADVEAAPR